ncbi:uncharacterized protein LOC129763032 [Toxorhynchites rutilus septentrionalis]|uniref:uncharacterized protein LOC129763032 n=1 Tax=Toxorhynchites rutilus septentrionalis TaxID=329112 RepID=UPI00247A7460|nr:uncharacterized protein LOC129763032 [Toxorhynchites rutilus septentrionalis]
MPKAVSSPALKKARKLLNIAFKNTDISETEESSDSDSSGDFSHVPLRDTKQITQLSNLSINRFEGMEEIAAQLRAINEKMSLFNERQQQQENALQSLSQQVEQTQIPEQTRTPEVLIQIQHQIQDCRVEDFFRIPDPIKSLPSFDGSRKQLTAWLTTAEETLDLFKGRISDQLFRMYVTAVTNKIEGRAKDILCLAGNPKDFESIKDILTNALGDRQELSTYKCQLWQHKMTDGMSIHKYYQRSKELIQNIKTLAKQKEVFKNNWSAINLFIDEDGLAAFISGFQGTYFGHVQAARPKDIEDAYAFLCKFKKKNKEIVANSISEKTHHKALNKFEGPFKGRQPNIQKPTFTPKNEVEMSKPFHTQNNYVTPMDVDPSLRSTLTLNKKLINNTELDSRNNDSSDEEETVEGNLNFHGTLPETDVNIAKDQNFLPYLLIEDISSNRKIRLLIDTGTNKNIIRDGIIPTVENTCTTKIKNIFGTHTINKKCKLELLGPNIPALTYFVLTFHEFFDGIIGSEFMSKTNTFIDYKTGTICINGIETRFKKYFPSNKYYYHTVTVETDRDGDWFVPTYKIFSQNTLIQPGLYSSRNNKTTIKVFSKNKEILVMPKLKLTVNNFETLCPIPNNSEEMPNKEVIGELIRTQHLSDYEKTRLKLDTIIDNHQVLLKNDEKLTSTTAIKHKILTKDEDPVYTKTYRYPHHYKEDVESQIREMLESGIITPSTSPYSSPIWVVPKKMDVSGKRKIRVVIDYRKLNDKTINDKFPMPEIEDILDNLGKSQYF